MNVFFISPGRTATTSFSEAFSCVPGYTSMHESRVELLGKERVSYPENHLEFDNRLVWFLPQLANKYAKSSILVIVHRDKEKIAQSYNKRWHKINIMKAYAQGIHMRDLAGNDIDVCRDYVNYVYDHLEFYRNYWDHVVDINMDTPSEGIELLLAKMECPELSGQVLEYMKNVHSNMNSAGLKKRVEVTWFNLRALIHDLFAPM
jgi:hypothetical protein